MTTNSGATNRVPSSSRSASDVTATVRTNDWINAEYKLLALRAPSPALHAIAGQFFHLACPHTQTEKPFFRRPMSIYKIDRENGCVEFLYKVTGTGTRSLASLHAGQAIHMLGPLGIGFTLDANWQNLVIAGRGVGLATLAPLVETAASRGMAITALISARTRNHALSVDRMLAAGAAVTILLDSDRSSSMENVERILRELATRGHADAFFTCGSNRLMLLMQRLGHEFGIPGQVAIEQQMACGLGMCFCCVRRFKTGYGIETRRVCWDGPVFNLQETLSW